MKMHTILSALLLPMFASAGVHAAAAAVEPRDLEFMNHAAIAGMFEIKASELAARRATDARHRGFAEMMLRDHRKLAADLRALAGRKGVTLPAELDAEHAGMLAELAKKKDGKDFDEHYADLMNEGHDKAVDLFEDASEDGKDADLRTLASTALPTLRNHRQHAEELDRTDISP